MKVLDKILANDTTPNSTNVLWLKTKHNEEPSLNANVNGEWFVIGENNTIPMEEIAEINAKIPEAATTENKLADKQYVADFVDRSLGTFLGTSEPDLTEEQFLTWADSLNPIENDFVYWDTIDENEVKVYKRYQYDGSDWVFQYDLNNSSFTDSEMAAIQSGITAEKVAQHDAKADKDTTAVVGNVAMFDASGNAVDGGESLDNLALKDGSYNTMEVGSAKNLSGRTLVTDSFFARPTGGESAEVANGLGQLMEVAGNSVKYNQCALTSENDLSDEVNGIHFVDNRDGTYTVYTDAGGCTKDTAKNLKCYNLFVTNHKYYLKGCPPGGNAKDRYRLRTTSTYGSASDIGEGVIFTFTGEASSSNTVAQPTISVYSGYTNTTPIVFRPQFIDLTALGIDSLTTVSEVEAWLSANWGKMSYYPSSAGSVINNNMTGLQSVSRNLLDPTTGKANIIGAYSDVYGNYYGITGTYGTLTFTSDLGEVSEITPDSDGKFLLEVPGELSVASAGADCSVFHWWDGTQTDYSEHSVDTANLDITHIYGKKNGAGSLVQVWPTGAPGLGDLKDMLRVENGEVVARRVIGEEDMGTLQWQVLSQSTQAFRSSGIDRKRAVSGDGESIILCAKYITIERQSNTSIGSYDKVICEVKTNSEGRTVLISDSTLNNYTSEQVASALSGVKVYFVLATPEVYTDLVYMGSSLFADGTPVTLPVNYQVDNWGDEAVLPKNTSSLIATAKPTITCKYSIDAVEMLNTHSDEIEDLYEEIDELDANKPNKTGDYPGMAVGSAKALEGNDQQSLNLVFNPISGASGIAKITDVRGKSLVWNQLVEPKSQQTTTTSDNLTFTFYTDGKLTVSGVAEAANNYAAFVLSIPSGHKIFIKQPEDASSSCYFQTNLGESYNTAKEIITLSETATRLKIKYGNGANVNISFYPQVFDLTALYGEGNEPSTVAEFEAMFPLPYYAYNAGAIINNKTTAIEANGFNQYNPATGKVSVLKGRTYYVDGTYTSLAYSDGTAVTVSSNLFTADRTDEVTVTGGNTTNTIINISDPAKNGTYEPYKKVTVNLNLPTLTGKLDGEGESVTIAPDGLKSFGADYDNCVVENGYIMKITEKIGRQLVSGAIGDTVTLTGCDTSATTFMCGSDIGTLSGGVLTLTAAATNVPVQFKLATPKVYVLDTTILVNFEAQKGGTLKQLPENTSTPTTTCCPLDIIYALDAVGILTNLPTNYDTTASLDALCTALATTLGSALNGTLSITRGAYDAATQKYAFTVTFTPNE